MLLLTNYDNLSVVIGVGSGEFLELYSIHKINPELEMRLAAGMEAGLIDPVDSDPNCWSFQKD